MVCSIHIFPHKNYIHDTTSAQEQRHFPFCVWTEFRIAQAEWGVSVPAREVDAHNKHHRSSDNVYIIKSKFKKYFPSDMIFSNDAFIVIGVILLTTAIHSWYYWLGNVLPIFQNDGDKMKLMPSCFICWTKHSCI